MTAPTGWHSCLCGCSHGCHTLTTLYCIVCVHWWSCGSPALLWCIGHASLYEAPEALNLNHGKSERLPRPAVASLKIILNAVRWDKIFSICPRSLETIVSQLKPINRIQVSKHEVLKSLPVFVRHMLNTCISSDTPYFGSVMLLLSLLLNLTSAKAVNRSGKEMWKKLM